VSKVSPVWHPFTQHKTFGPAIDIERASGAYLYARGGKPILDGISSWWVNTHGHCHPKIVAAVQAQAARLDQVIFAGFTHNPAERLARKVLRTVQDRVGASLEFIFYSDSGSTAVEVALKMAAGHFAHQGQARTKIIALEGGYHGDTFGAMAAGGRSLYNKLYEPYLFEVEHLPFPGAGHEEGALEALERFIRRHGHETAAFIFEPLVQGASGMRTWSPAVLREMAEMCRAAGILLIADEVMTGFGRTGTMFACEQAGVAPDFMCLSKGLTGGFLPMGATLTTRHVYKSFYSNDKARQFFHSSSFTGNPLSCAAALASMEIWAEEPVMRRIGAIQKSHMRAAQWFSARPDVAECRVVGSIMALDVQDEAGGYLSDLAPRIYDFMMAEGILLRPIGNTVYILPPYCITEEELERIYETLWRSLDSLRDVGTQQAA
jgi:adenosylmethionine---8-amino-7-oxononanoate aminotransferase